MKERSKPHPDLIIKALMEGKQVFRGVTSDAKTGSGKTSVTLPRETEHFLSLGSSTNAHANHFLLVHTNRAVIKTTKEKGSTLLHHFIQQSDQNNVGERKAVLKVLDRSENSDRCLRKWGPDHRDQIHWSFLWTDQGYSLRAWQGQTLSIQEPATKRTRLSSSHCWKTAFQRDRFLKTDFTVT